MALTDEEQKALEAKIAKMEADLAKAGEASKRAAELETANAQLAKDLKQKDQDAIVSRVKTEYPEIAEMIGDLIPVGDYEGMKVKAEKLKALKGSPKKDADLSAQAAGTTGETDEQKKWREAQASSPARDQQTQMAAVEAKKRYEEDAKSGNIAGVVDGLLKKHAPTVKKFFKVP